MFDSQCFIITDQRVDKMSDAKSLLNDVKRFYLLQAERVETYALFEE